MKKLVTLVLLLSVNAFAETEKSEHFAVFVGNTVIGVAGSPSGGTVGIKSPSFWSMSDGGGFSVFSKWVFFNIAGTNKTNMYGLDLNYGQFITEQFRGNLSIGIAAISIPSVSGSTDVSVTSALGFEYFLSKKSPVSVFSDFGIFSGSTGQAASILPSMTFTIGGRFYL